MPASQPLLDNLGALKSSFRAFLYIPVVNGLCLASGGLRVRSQGAEGRQGTGAPERTLLSSRVLYHCASTRNGAGSFFHPSGKSPLSSRRCFQWFGLMVASNSFLLLIFIGCPV